jgi:hypothetical protein
VTNSEPLSQTTEMDEERVARAIAACDHEVTCDADWQCCVVEARAAIAAMPPYPLPDLLHQLLATQLELLKNDETLLKNQIVMMKALGRLLPPAPAPDCGE